MLWPKKNSYKEFDNERRFLRLENPPSPITFLMVSPLIVYAETFHKPYNDIFVSSLNIVYSTLHFMCMSHFIST